MNQTAFAVVFIGTLCAPSAASQATPNFENPHAEGEKEECIDLGEWVKTSDQETSIDRILVIAKNGVLGSLQVGVRAVQRSSKKTRISNGLEIAFSRVIDIQRGISKELSFAPPLRGNEFSIRIAPKENQEPTACITLVRAYHGKTAVFSLYGQ